MVSKYYLQAFFFVPGSRLDLGNYCTVSVWTKVILVEYHSRLHLWLAFTCGLYLYPLIWTWQCILPGNVCYPADLVVDPDADQ